MGQTARRSRVSSANSTVPVVVLENLNILIPFPNWSARRSSAPFYNPNEGIGNEFRIAIGTYGEWVTSSPMWI
jgi:hypothetical protein